MSYIPENFLIEYTEKQKNFAKDIMLQAKNNPITYRVMQQRFAETYKDGRWHLRGFLWLMDEIISYTLNVPSYEWDIEEYYDVMSAALDQEYIHFVEKRNNTTDNPLCIFPLPDMPSI